LLASDLKQMRVGRLIEANSSGQEDTHNPVFGRAGKIPIQDIPKHTKDPEDMKCTNRKYGAWQLPKAQEWEIAVSNHDGHASEEQ